MRVYRWKKPKLDISTVVDGSLAADTKYYVYTFAWNQLYTQNWDWYDNSSPVSDIYEVSTNSTNKSIKTSLYFDGSILDVSSNVAGICTITSPIHCLDTTNRVTISGTTSYNGTYPITRKDYNKFDISANYVANEQGSWRADGYVNLLTHWILYCASTNPANSDGSYKGTSDVTNKFSHTGSEGITNASSYTITSQPSNTRYTPMVTWSLVPYQAYKFYLTTGYPVLAGTETTLSDASIQQELVDASLGDYNRFPYWVTCNLNFANLVKTFSYQSINFIGSRWYTPLSTYDNCVVSRTAAFSYNYGTGEGFWGILNNSAIMADVAGKMSPWTGINRTFTPFWGDSSKRNVIASSNDYGWDQASNVNSRFLDITYIGNYAMLFYHGNTYSAGYIMENIDLRDTSSLSYDMCLSGQGGTPAMYKILNVDTARVDNEKVIVSQGTGFWNASTGCYRSKNIQVVDKNIMSIPGAIVTLQAKNVVDTSIYTQITDASGMVYFEVLEQFCSPNEGLQTKTNTIYKNWNLLVNKDGYQIFNGNYSIATDIPTNIVAQYKESVKIF